MIFSTHTLYSRPVQLTPTVTISGIEAGEKGRGRESLFLPCPDDFTLEKGENSGVTIGLTRSGRPRINISSPSTQKDFLLLSSSGGYTRRGNGTVYVLGATFPEDYTILGKGNGADGDAGRIGYWDVRLIEIPPLRTPLFRVKMSGGNPSRLIFKKEGVWQNSSADEYVQLMDVMGDDIPFTLKEGGIFQKEEWKPI